MVHLVHIKLVRKEHKLVGIYVVRQMTYKVSVCMPCAPAKWVMIFRWRLKQNPPNCQMHTTCTYVVSRVHSMNSYSGGMYIHLSIEWIIQLCNL